MYAMPYPDTSNCFFIKSLGSRGILEWNCVFVLNSYAKTSRCRLRLQMPPNDSCPPANFSMDEDIILYSENFGIKMLDLMAPDLLQTYHFSEVKFHNYFVNLPFHTIKLCLTKISPEKIEAMVKSRPNLEISSTKGVMN